MTDATRKAISKRLRYEILRRDNHQCRYCGATAPGTPLTVDHVIPAALGGSDEPSNLVTACRDCNSGKSSTNPDDPIVEDVAADALRWAQAMEVVSQSMRADRANRRLVQRVFRDDIWNSWTYGPDKKTVDLPADWRTSIDSFCAAGLDIDDLEELVDVAMGSRSRDAWRYFCGCCWRRIEQIQKATADYLRAVDEGD